MKNLFNYATKELTQDAFLRWILENHDDSELEKVAIALLKKFCNLSDDESIVQLYTVAQWNKIDISVWITTSKRKIALFVEDKTFSNEHNQLAEYNKHIDVISDREIYKVFYKTDKIENEECKRISKVNEKSATPWGTFNINDIAMLFNEFANIENLILRQYIDYVNQIYAAYATRKKPTDSDSQIDFIKWKVYFGCVVEPELKKEFGDSIVTWVSRAGQYPYVCLGIAKAGYAKNVPYLEIRSRDCIKNNYQSRMLCYGMPETDIAQQQKLIERIRDDNILECKRIMYRKKGKEIFPKQIGYTLQMPVANDDEFVELVKKYINYYLIVMREWE